MEQTALFGGRHKTRASGEHAIITVGFFCIVTRDRRQIWCLLQ